jgi:thermostable 8-oxoguanine DNA glycosylase
MKILPADLQNTFFLFKDKIIERLNGFQNVKDDNIFYEFCFCILTPQSSAENA